MKSVTWLSSRARYKTSMIDQAERYSRQIRFAGIGATGQQRLTQARVAVVGCGALGAAASEQLARAGVGYLRLIDRDVVELSNLQRQCLYTEADALDEQAQGHRCSIPSG